MSSEDQGVQTATAFFARAEALQGFGRPDEAIAELRRGLAEFPQDSELLGYLGWLLFFAGHPEEAERSAQRALAVRPGDPRALNTLCAITAADGRADESLAHARELQHSLPDWEVSHLNAAAALLAFPKAPRNERKARREEVRRLLERALELAPEDVETMRRSMVMLRRIGDDEAASDLLDRALAIEPANEELLLHAAAREQERKTGAQPLVSVVQSAAHDAAALRIMSGVVAENPMQRAVAREINDDVWLRTRMLATVALWMSAMLAVFAYLVFGEPMPGSRRTQVRFAEAMLILPMLWFVLLFTIRRKGLPKRFMRRLYARVWWVWIGFVLAAVGGLGTLLWAASLAIRSGEAQLQMQGSYVGGITRGIGFTVWILLIAELLFVFARFRSEQRSGMFPDDDEGVSAAQTVARDSLWGFVRVGLAGLIAALPIYAAPIEMRPEAAGVLPVIAVALALPALVAMLLKWARVLRLRGARPGSALLVTAAILLAITGIMGTWLLADRHAGEFDPPPTPWELDLRERQRELNDQLEQFDLGDIDPEL